MVPFFFFFYESKLISNVDSKLVQVAYTAHNTVCGWPSRAYNLPWTPTTMYATKRTYPVHDGARVTMVPGIILGDPQHQCRISCSYITTNIRITPQEKRETHTQACMHAATTRQQITSAQKSSTRDISTAAFEFGSRGLPPCMQCNCARAQTSQ